MPAKAAARSKSSFRPPTPSFRLTPRQAELNELLGGPQRHTLIYGGSRGGKTLLLVRAILIRALRAPNSRHAMLRLRANAARASLWLDTLPKTAALCFPQLTLTDRRQDGFVELPNGSEIWIGGLDDRERVEKILGQEFATLYFCEASQIPYASVTTALTRLAQQTELRQRCYIDLNPVGTRHWTYQLFVTQRDPLTQRPVSDPAEYCWAAMSPLDNRDNLSAEYLAALDALPERQRRRFYEGEYQADIEGALWTFETLEHARCDAADVPPDLARVVVAVDPSGTAGGDGGGADDVGIVVAGRSADGIAYALDDLTCNLPPEGWARRVVDAFARHKADRIVAERNYGGDMVRAVIHAIDRSVPVTLVSASRGKSVRAEPVSALYGHERDGEWNGDRVRHAGEFRQLEDELLNFSSAGYIGSRSPNRADALVWALTDLLVTPMRSEGFFELMRQQHAAAAPQAEPAAAAVCPWAPGSQEWLDWTAAAATA